MKILHMLTSGQAGGIESLCRDIARFGKCEHGFCFVTGGGAVYEQMKKEGRTVWCLENEGRKFSLRKLRILKKISADYDAVIVHHEDPFLRLYYLLLVKSTSKCGIAMVHSCYGDERQSYKNKLKRFVNRQILQKCFDVSDGVWYVSKAGRESCLKVYSVAADKERIIYNGVSPEFLSKAADSFPKVEKPYRITYIGRLVDIKGVDMLISAFANIACNRDVVLDIVGDGEERGNLEELAKHLGLSEKINFYGQQTDVSGFLKKSDIFVYPSVCEEVFGISVAEAMAYGLPCIANNVGGIPEIINDGENGFLTKEPTIAELERIISNVLDMYESGAIKKISQNAKATAQKFSVVRTCEVMESELKK